MLARCAAGSHANLLLTAARQLSAHGSAEAGVRHSTSGLTISCPAAAGLTVSSDKCEPHFKSCSVCCYLHGMLSTHTCRCDRTVHHPYLVDSCWQCLDINTISSSQTLHTLYKIIPLACPTPILPASTATRSGGQPSICTGILSDYWQTQAHCNAPSRARVRFLITGAALDEDL